MEVSSIWTNIKDIVNEAGQGVMNLLPTSPFRAYIDKLENYEWLSTLNWVVPIDNFIVIGEAWLVAVGLFYLYSIILRWVKAIE